MKYCPKCGRQMPDDALFCMACGTEFRAYQPPRADYDEEKEKLEAIAAGEQALSSLYAAQGELDKARGWGVVDILGGGLITSMIKQSKMSNAQQYINQAKADLRSFRNELNDIANLRYIDIDVDDFLSFADWFFDGFAVDFMVQDKINRARAQVAEAISHVEEILGYLKP